MAELTADQKWRLDVIAHVRPYRSDEDRTAALVAAVEKIVAEHTEPHAYAVETLWNRGGSGERWGMAMEMSDYRQPLGREDAEQLLAEMVEFGHDPDAVRLVAVIAEPLSRPGRG